MDGWQPAAGQDLLDRVGLLLTGDMSQREPHLRVHGGLEAADGARHPLAVAREQWWYEPTGAAIRAEDTVRFLQSGLEIELGEAAATDRGGVTLTGGRRIDAEQVVVCAGPETYRLIGLPEPERMRSVRFSFALREPLSAPAPCWIHRDEELCEPFYAVMDGPDHYSIGLSTAVSAQVPEADHVRDAHRRTLDVVARAFPGLIPIAERVVACEFSINPGADRPALAHDGWDLRDHHGVVGLAGPSLFKFAPLLGRAVVDRVAALEGQAPVSR